MKHKFATYEQLTLWVMLNENEKETELQQREEMVEQREVSVRCREAAVEQREQELLTWESKQ